MKSSLTIIYILITLVISVSTKAQVVYVDIDAAGNNDGSSWVDAFTDSQDGINAAFNQGGGEVWVSAGTYYPGTTSTDKFIMKANVEIYGGFIGSETLLSQRDFKTNVTILSGANGVQTNQYVFHNNYTAGSPLDDSAILDGFEITGASSLGTGSGMTNFYASPIIRNCKFHGLTSGQGGAVYNQFSSPTFINCEFYNNTAYERGGAVFNSGSSISSYVITFTNCLFYGNQVNNSLNSATSAAALMSGQGVVTKIYNSTVYDNTCSGCSSPQGAVRMGGVDFELINSIIWGNNSGAEVYDVAQSSTIENNIIEGGFTSGTDILDEDPLWTDPDNGDFSISFCSPAIDFGVSGVLTGISEDINGATRVIGDNPDLGPIELQDGVTVVSSSETCATAPDGSISFTVAGSTTFEYSIDGGTTYTSNSIGGLSSGTYNLMIREVGSQCTREAQYTIASTAAITISNTINDAACTNTSDGSIVVSATSSNTPLTYSIDGTNFQSSNSFTGLAPGNYNVYVQDNLGCVKSMIETIGPEDDSEPYTLSVTDVSCNGQSDGEILITATGTNTPYQYHFDGDPPVSFGNFQGLAAGTYDVVIQNGQGCMSDPISVTVNEPTTLSASFVDTNISCNGADDGSIDITITGGTTPYEYQVNGGGYQSITGSNLLLDSLNAGSRGIDVRDANNCITSSSTIIISEPTTLSSSSSSTDVTSCTGDDGTITASVSGGTSPYQYSLDGGTSFTVGTSYNGTSLAPGIYEILFEDANGCQVIVQDTVNNPFAYTISETVTDATCNGAQDGSITITASGGVSPFTYSLDGITYQSSNVFNVGAGNHTYYVKDNTGCVSFSSISVSEPTIIQPSLSIANPILCNGDNSGSLEISAVGGTGPYTFSQDGITFNATDSITGLTAGTHSVYVKDANNCIVEDTISLTEPPVLTVSATQNDSILCNGDNTASFTVIGSGGVLPYLYSINGTNFGTDPNFGNLAVATYTYYVSDSNGCSTSGEIVIGEPDPLTVSLSISDSISCLGATDGSITITTSGGSGGVEYSLDGITFQSGNVFSNLGEGTYGITTRDVNQCSRTDSITITSPEVLRLGLTVSDITCNGETDGSIVAIPSGGTPPYEYGFNGGNFSTQDTFENLGPATYTVEVKDAHGCTFSTSATLAEPDVLAFAAIETTDATCYGDASGIISISVTGGTSPYEYSLDGTSFQSDSVFSVLDSGSYTVTVKDVRGCTITSGTIRVSHPLELTSVTSTTNLTCNGDASGSIAVEVAGGILPYQFSLDSINFQSTSTFTGLDAGTYTVHTVGLPCN